MQNLICLFIWYFIGKFYCNYQVLQLQMQYNRISSVINEKHSSIMSLVIADFHEEMFHISKDIWTAMMGCYLRVHLPAKAQGIHVLQFLSPLTPTANYYFCLIRKLRKLSAHFYCCHLSMSHLYF